MQGIQFFSGADDAWAGFAGRYTERVRDEFGKLRIWAWGIEGSNAEGRKVYTLHDWQQHVLSSLSESLSVCVLKALTVHYRRSRS